MTEPTYSERLARQLDQAGKVIINTMFKAYDWQNRETWPKPEITERRDEHRQAS